MAPGLPQIGEHFHETSSTIIAMSLSILLLAWVFAPLVVAPLSEIYGRECTHLAEPRPRHPLTFPSGRWLYHISNLLTLAFSLACAFAPTMGSLIGFRFLSKASSSLSRDISHQRSDRRSL
jgi:MFS family permease